MRVLLIIFASASGYFIADQIDSAYNVLGSHQAIKDNFRYLGFGSGLIIAILTILFEKRARKTPLRIVAGGALGLIAGLIVANLLTYPLVLNVLKNPYLELVAYLLINCVTGYVGLSIGMRKGDEFRNRHLQDTAGNEKDSGAKILDTSVIIDGRIADICEIGFIDGSMVIPQFVLRELQYIADSPDPVKRTRGKRGLDILQGISVLNLNQLATAMRPAILPGEVMNILILKEGKEQGQGIGYLEDGTMVVIDNARRHMGKNVDVAVTSVLQTASGRMIFSKLKEEVKGEVYYQAAN